MADNVQFFYPSQSAVMGIAGGIGSFGLSALGLAVAAALFFSWMNSETIWSLKNACVSGSLGGVGLLLLGMAVHFWRLGRHPLIVESNGRVTYREKELIPPGASRELFIRRDLVGDEGGPSEIFRLFVQDGAGTDIELPSPYFTTCGTRIEAESLALCLADALRIPVCMKHSETGSDS